MLFIKDPLVKVQVQPDRKVIILSESRIMFSHLDFIQQYLTMPLISKYPLDFHYCPETKQTLVRSTKTIEIFYCDWQTSIKLTRVCILNEDSIHDKIHTVYHDKHTGWNIVGTVKQYQPTKVTFRKYQKPISQSQNIIAQCHIKNSSYVLTSSALKRVQYQNSNQDKTMQLNWKDRMMVIRNTNSQIQMSGSRSLDGKRDILCINGFYALIISKTDVLSTVQLPYIAHTSNNLVINKTQANTLLTINLLKNQNFIDIGTIPAHTGDLFSAYLFDKQLTMLFYEEQQLQIKSLALIDANEQNKKSNSQPRKILKGSISKIIQYPKQEDSQYVSKIDVVKQRDSLKVDKQKQRELENGYDPYSKPIIKDIIDCNDEVQPDLDIGKSDSQVLSRSGIDLVKKNSLEEQQFSLNQIIPENAKSNSALDNSDSLSLRGRRRSVKPIKKSQSIKADTSNGYINHSQDSALGGGFQDYTQTPGFGFQPHGGQNWQAFNRNWQDQVPDKVNQDSQAQDDDVQQQSLVMNQSQRTILKKLPGILTKKAQYFLPKNQQTTKQMVAQIESSSYCKLIEQQAKQNPDRVQQLITQFLSQILKQQYECPFFFANTLRTYSPQYTKDKITRYFHDYLSKQIYLPQLTIALQQFKLSEVPLEALKFPQQFLKIIKIIYKDMYIQQLIKPSKATISQLLQSYFNTSQLSQQIITIQDQQINITHPRNMLNILLYLNQVFNLPIQDILKTYCAKLLKYQHTDILQKLIEDQVFEICQVDRQVLDQVICETIDELLQESLDNLQYLWEIVAFLSNKLLDEYRIKLAVINQLNSYNLVFPIESVVNIKDPNTNIYLFFDNMITQNTCKALTNLKLPSLYRSLYWLQEGDKLAYMTNQYIELSKSLAQKLMEKKYMTEAMKILDTVTGKVKKSFIAKILYRYLNGKFMNRLTGMRTNNLIQVFPEFMSGKGIDPDKIPRDKLINPEFSQNFSCSYAKFSNAFDKYIEGPTQLKFLAYGDINCAHQLFLSLDQAKKKKFNRLFLQIENYLIVQMQDINENDQSLNPKGQVQILFNPDNEQMQLESIAGTSSLNRQQYLLCQQQNAKRPKKVFKSMTLIDHYRDLNSSIYKAVSDKRASQDLQNNQELKRLKLTVGKNQIVQSLNDIYNNQDQQIFLKSLKMVDLQKVKLYHLDAFRAIVAKNVEYPLARIIPFSVLLTQNNQQAFDLMKGKLQSQVSLQNFWVIYTIVQILIGLGIEVAKILISKIINYYRQDQLAEDIKALLITTELNKDRRYMKQMAKIAQKSCLQKISAVFVSQ